ncbi:MAG TPA: proton-conducting transporter membrane subunit [Verrucomicrobiae bacterium]|nr:proton-conducting transporter membrane subunit [Verrucomicrobiae bacterium]
MIPGPFFLVAAFSLLAAILVGRRAPRAWLAATLGGLGAGLLAAVAVLLGGAEWNWRSTFPVAGEPLHLRLDALSALFLALLAVVGAAGSVYSREYWADRAHPRSARSGRVWWSVLLLCMGLVLLSSNGLHFLMAWELFTVSSYFLITLNRQPRAVRAAGWLYLAASHAATLCLFAFFVTLAARTGSWELGPMREQAELAPLFWLALVGFGVKAGVFPLHIWLPSAHANAPSHVSAIMSGVTIKLGIYGLVRFSSWLPVPAAAGWVVVALGLASAVLGVAFALGQHDLKRLLAYHSVENIGIILIGLGFALVAVEHGQLAWGGLALAGGLLHVWNHGLFKSLLFLGAGSVLHATGTREMSRLGGLWRHLPWTAGLFALGAVAIAGLPPLNGFVSEWLVYLGLFDAVNAHANAALPAVLAVVLLALTGALALACFIKVCGVVFLGAPRTADAEHAHECGLGMRGPMLALAAGCVVTGLVPVVFWPALARAVVVWNPAWSGLDRPVSLNTLGTFHLALALAAVLAAWLLRSRTRANGLRRTVTWDCGYAAPTARMQYTAGSFAATITGWFDWILHPHRHERCPEGTFPTRASFAEHTPETVLEEVVAPGAGLVMRVAAVVRRLQHGRVQAYVLYLVAGLAALAILVMIGGGL